MTGESRVQMWHCNWDWCPLMFPDGRALLDHLNKEHFSNILRVKKADWDLHQRAYEGRSGATDSLLKAFSQPPEPSTTPPPIPKQDPPSRAPSVGPSTPHRRRSSFAAYAAQSSPVTTPIASPLPASPTLPKLIADAINSAAALNAAGPRLRGPVSLPLPRRRTRSPDKAARGRLKVSAQRTSQESSSSVEDVETQLTQNVVPSPPGQVTCATYPVDPYPPLRTQAPYGSQSMQTSQASDSQTRSFSSGNLFIYPKSSQADEDPRYTHSSSQAQSQGRSSQLPLLTQAPYFSQ